MKIYFGAEYVDVEEDAFGEFASRYQQVAAGGGLVRNSDGKVLMILRHGIWDLPKGKQEPDEEIETCALREVEEETGLTNLKLGKLICITHHTYKVFGISCLKNTYWYEMQYDGNETPVPQAEEDITRAEWIGPDALPGCLETTYPSIREVFGKNI